MLSQCTLARDATVHNADFRKGSTVNRNPGGTMQHVFLPARRRWGSTVAGVEATTGGRTSTPTASCPP